MFYDRFIELCKEKGVKPTPLVVSMGLSSSNVSVWKKGGTPRPAVLKKLAEYFGVSIADLMDLDTTVQGQETKKSPDTKSGEEIPHGKMRQVWSEGGIRVYLDEDANVPQENLEDIIKYIKLRQRDVGR